MAKRRSFEASVLAYFDTETLDKVTLMLGLVKDVVKRRTPKATVRGTKGTRVGKSAIPQAGSTAFDTTELERAQ